MRWSVALFLFLPMESALASIVGLHLSFWGKFLEALLVLSSVIVALAYGYGHALLRQNRKRKRDRLIWQMLAFTLGWLALAVALFSSLDSLAGISFAAHMAQHVVLLIIAPPLIVLGKPLAPLILALPPAWRRPLGAQIFKRLSRPPWRLLARLPIAASVHSIVVWLWHVPLAFQAALENEFMHAVEHFSLFGSALLFWWGVIHSGRRGYSRYGSGILSLFLVAMHTKLLGVLIAFAPAPLYTAYAAGASPWGLSTLEDQQLAGLIMLLPCEIVYLLAGLTLMAAWLTTTEPYQGRLPRREAVPKLRS